MTSGTFQALRQALNSEPDSTGDPAVIGSQSPEFRTDGGRWRRTGIPEVVHAEFKSDATVVASLRELAERQGRAMASRIASDRIERIVAGFTGELSVEVHETARCIVVARENVPRPRTGGAIGVLSAGTSDIPVASEAALIAMEMGVKALMYWDVGVAGLHRLVQPLEAIAAANVDAIVVAAGMDGALPSVVAGLVDVPVIGLPTSVGYGFGGQGVGAMTTMLQSCAPGLVVVNIDNGIGAGSTAALIANRAARLRGEPDLQPR